MFHRPKSYKKLLLLWAVLLIFWLGPARRTEAHPAPSVIHDYIVSLTTERMTVSSYLRVSPELVPEVYRQLDTDGNGEMSEAERQAWVSGHHSKLGLALNNQKLDYTLSAVPAVSREDLLLSINNPVVVTYTATLPEPVAAGKQRIQITYGDNYLSYDEYYVSVANDQVNDGKPHNIAKKDYPATYQIVYYIPPAEDKSPLPDGQLAVAPYTAVGQGTPVAETPQQAPPVEKQTGLVDSVLNTLRSWNGEMWSAAGMLAVALFLGALHALTPGHGKAMVAAYLIGSRGRPRDAVLLGGIVTVTHTAGVIALGLALVLISTFSMPRALQPALELISGLLVAGLGLYLLIVRVREARTPGADHEHSHAHGGQAQSHVLQQTVAVGAGAIGTRALSAPMPVGAHTLPVRRVASSGGQPGETISQQSAQTHDRHPHDHSHDGDSHDHDHNHEHEHAAGLVHSHGGREHSHGPVDVRGVGGMKALVGLGVSGGLVPCPDALAILLMAGSVKQFGLGLGLVIAFSLGLALVLVVIGVALVQMKGALERSRAGKLASNPVWTRWVPVASAGVVTVVGVLLIMAALGRPWE